MVTRNNTSIPILHQYRNGNYTVTLYEDGTKVRETQDTQFVPEFPECIDVCISNRCNKGCKYCYMECTKEGKVANLSSYYSLFKTLPRGVELALNGNDISDPQLLPFLEFLKERGLVANLTVHSTEFRKNWEKLKEWSDKKLIHGLGVSLDTAIPNLLLLLCTYFPNAVIHTVAGVMGPKDYVKLAGMKVLILGYKNIGRGVTYLTRKGENVTKNIEWLKRNVKVLAQMFEVLSFDNLAIEQLNVQKLFPRLWNERYMGDDGQFTFYLDLVKGKYYKSSLESNSLGHSINNKTITEMFQHIRNQTLETN